MAQNIIKKLTSRKFLTCVAGVVMGACMVFGLDTTEVNTIAGAITTVASVVMYIYTEGKIDAEAVQDAASKVHDAVDTVQNIEG